MPSLAPSLFESPVTNREKVSGLRATPAVDSNPHTLRENKPVKNGKRTG